MADIGMGQVQAGGAEEMPLLTAGDDLNNIARMIKPGQTSYSAKDVISYLLSLEVPATKQDSLQVAAL
ncbi:hypothetical protein D3C86_2028690 [compost metagenome]